MRSSTPLWQRASLPMPKDGNDRASWAPGNIALMRELVPRLAELSPRAIVVVVTNPVDAITYHVQKLARFPWQRVIGTGTLIEQVKCWTREQWAQRGVDVDKDWPKEGVRIKG